MSNSNFSELFPIEVTTHNLYFHEEASVFSIDAYENCVATGGGDGIVRLWKVIDDNTKLEENYKYTTALNSSLQISYISDLVDHKKAVNCVRFSCQGILASASDSGRVVLSENEKTYVLREPDGLDCYELLWADNKLFIGLSNGIIEEYSIQEGIHKFVRSINIHSDIVQGMSYNPKYQLVLSTSKDKTTKISHNLEILETFSITSIGKSFFKRTTFSSCNNLAYICNIHTNIILVVHYPFTEYHWLYQLGPFNSEIIKIVDNGVYLFILCRSTLYVYKNFELLVCIEQLCFKSITDATIIENALFVSSLDGFIASFKWS